MKHSKFGVLFLVKTEMIEIFVGEALLIKAQQRFL